MLTFSIIGLGNRGSVYADGLKTQKNVKIVSVCDTSPESLLKAKEVYGVEDKNLFSSDEEFFKEKRADVLIIATLDGLHKEQAVKGMSLGYDILLEKPMAPTPEECDEIKAASEKYKRDVVICHNLRYTPFYQKIKTIIADGEIGRVLSVEQSENVAYHHYMCSFIRGKWHRSEETSSIVLQKCCHDLDIITWFIGDVNETLQSLGDLRYYTKSRAPKDAADLCVNCKIKNCPLNAYDFYVKAHESMCVPYGFDYSDENIKKYLSDENNPYGKCAFKSDNDVCDRQTVNIRYDNGVTANLLLHGFANDTDRITCVFGTEGRVYGRFNEGVVHVERFDGKRYDFDVNKEVSADAHNGGDVKLVRDYVTYKLTGDRPLGISRISDSVKSHKLAFEAETVRVKNVKSQKPMSVDGDFTVKTGGAYLKGEEFIKAGKVGELQIIAVSANYTRGGAEKIENDLCYAFSLIKSDLYDYDVSVSGEGYKHGFIDMYFTSGVMLRYAFTAAPISDFTTIRFYGTRGTVFCDTEKGMVSERSTVLFEKETEHKVNGESFCKASRVPGMIKTIAEVFR